MAKGDATAAMLTDLTKNKRVTLSAYKGHGARGFGKAWM